MNDILSQEEIDLLLKSTQADEEEELSDGLVSINELIDEEIKNNFTLLSYSEDEIDNSNLAEFEGTSFMIGFPSYTGSKSAIFMENIASQSISKMVLENIEFVDEFDNKSVTSELFSHILDVAKEKYSLAFLADLNNNNLLTTSTNSVFSSLINLSEIGRFIKVTYIFKLYDFKSEVIQILPAILEDNLEDSLKDNLEDDADAEDEPLVQDYYESAKVSEGKDIEDVEGLSLEDILGDDDELNNIGEEIEEEEYQETEDGFFESFDDGSNLSLLKDVPLEISVELGRVNKKLIEVLTLSPGKVVELDKLSGEPLDILVNGKIVAKGEVVVVEDSFGVRILDIESN